MWFLAWLVVQICATTTLISTTEASQLFSPSRNNCTKAKGSTDRDIWWECSSALRHAFYGSIANTAIALDPNFKYQLGDVPLVGRVLDGSGAVIRPTPGASCVVYIVGGQGGGVRSSFSHATLTGTVLRKIYTVADAPVLNNHISVRGSLEVASGSWVFIKTTGAGKAPGPVITWHATRVVASKTANTSSTATRLYLLDALPAYVMSNSSVYLSKKQMGRNVGGAGLVRVEGGVLGHRSTAYNLSTHEPVVTTWGRTQQWTLRDLSFFDALCAIQLDTTVLRNYDDTAKGPPHFQYSSGVIETGTVTNIVIRGGAVLAGIIDSGCTNGVMFTSVHIWPSSYQGEPTSFCNVLKDNRGYPFWLPELDSYWAGPMTMAAIGGSHAFTGLYMHSAEVGLISAAGMQDTFSDMMGDGLGVMMWFRFRTWGSLVRGVNCAYVQVCARLSDRASSISFSDVMAPGNAKNTHAGMQIGQGSSAYVAKWMALKGNATRILGPGVVVSADHGGARIQSFALQTVSTPAANHDAQDSLSASRGRHHPGVDAPENTYCTAGSSACPNLLSCQGTQACDSRAPGTPLAYGSFSDQSHTAAFGCSLVQDGLVSVDMEKMSDPTMRVDDEDSVPSPVCEAPADTVGQQLSRINGWGVEWSGKYPPWAYNMNVACPCQTNGVQ